MGTQHDLLDLFRYGCSSNRWRASLITVAALALTLSGHPTAFADSPHEVWAIDQSNSPGKTFGGRIFIWEGQEIESHPERARAQMIDLSTTVSDLCVTQTGAVPVRPHMLAFNAAQTHAIISFVASGHVVFLDAETRTPLTCIRTSIGAGGARQVHFAIPSPDQTYVSVANQNGKLFERIDTDYSTNSFALNPAATINLFTCMTPNGVPCESAGIRDDNAPICPIIDSTSRFSFVTLRGGGLFVVDSKSTPMQIVAEYDRTTIHPNGCLGAETAGKMYIDSGGGTPANLFEADLYALPVTGYSPNNQPNTPAPKLIFSEDVDEADSHGAALVQQGSFLWVADRGRNFLYVVDTESDRIVNRIILAGPVSADPTPDLLFPSPQETRVYISLRGPNPLTADPHVSTGSTPGVGVIKVKRGGRDGEFVGIAPVSNIDSSGVERADIHAMAVRRK
jgi:DNA-binding beta-propeller fold protein YncE